MSGRSTLPPAVPPPGVAVGVPGDGPGESRPALWRGWVLAGWSLCLLAGCDSSEPVRHYTAERIPVTGKAAFPQRPEMAPATARRSPQGPPTDRMIGAILPRKDQTWFFKLQGPVATTAEILPGFLSFITKLTFENDAPVWGLPEGWEVSQKSAPGRFATLTVPLESGPADLTVTALATPAGPLADYVRLNVNRWRGQLALPEQSAEEFEERAVTVKLKDETQVWLVNMEGWAASGAGRGGVAGGGGAGGPTGGAPAGEKSPRLPFQYQVPEGWSAAELNQFRLAAWRVTAGEQQVMITVSVAGGDLVGNLNRWRGQLQLPAASEAELKGGLETLKLGSAEGVYAQLHAPEGAGKPQSILGVIASSQGQQWFFKLQGDSDLAKAEAARFEEFVRSVRFP